MKKALYIWFGMTVVSFLILITFPLELHFDEAQYWSWSKVLQWSYYSKPPMIAFLNYVSSYFIGPSEVSVRLWSWLFANATALVFLFWVKQVTKDEKKALKSLSIYYLFPHYWYTMLFFTTDVLLLFFYMLSLFILYKIHEKDRLRDWILLGIVFSLGMLSKYAILVLLVPILYMTFVRPKFSFLHFLIFVCIAAIGCFPIIAWASTHDYVSFRHLFFLSGANHTSLDIVRGFRNIFEFLGGQLILLGGLVFFYIFSGVNKEVRKYGFIRTAVIIPYLLTILVFILISFNRHRAANINWTLFVLCPMPYILYEGLAQFRRKRFFLMTSIMTIMLYLFLFDGMYQGEQSFIAKVVPINNVTKRLIGWKQLSNKLDHEVDHSKNTVVICTHYGIASELMFYGQGKYEILYFNQFSRMNQYDLWMSPVYDKYKGWDAIVVTDRPDLVDLEGNYERCDNMELFKWSNQKYEGQQFYLHRINGIHITDVEKHNF